MWLNKVLSSFKGVVQFCSAPFLFPKLASFLIFEEHWHHHWLMNPQKIIEIKLNMKKLLLFGALIGINFGTIAQNIDDNKVRFEYIQLPSIVIDEAYDTYEVVVEHGYQQANQDSILLNEARQKLAMDMYEAELAVFKRSVDSIDRSYFTQMADWEIRTNKGETQANGQPLPQPISPMYPTPPIYPEAIVSNLHSELNESTVMNATDLQGFSKGANGAKITINILPIQDISIKETKKGTGASTKYTYKAFYRLPIELTVETPSQGILIKLRILEDQKSYKIGEYKSKYEYQREMLDRKLTFNADLERYARTQALNITNSYLNDEIAYPVKTRVAELYQVKRFKNYDYSDVTTAYTYTLQAIQLVKSDKDRSGAINAIDKAISAWNVIMEESNTHDSKARINDKVTAMIQCNLAELYLWKADFNQAELQLNLAIANGGKFKRHAEDEKAFLANQRKRWNATH